MPKPMTTKQRFFCFTEPWDCACSPTPWAAGTVSVDVAPGAVVEEVIAKLASARQVRSRSDFVGGSSLYKVTPHLGQASPGILPPGFTPDMFQACAAACATGGLSDGRYQHLR